MHGYLGCVGAAPARRGVRPIYQELVETPAGKARARAIYTRARSRYDAVSVRTLDEIVSKAGA